MRLSIALLALLALALAPAARAHDLFLELPDHRLAPRADASVALVNGTFGRSDNVITRDRMLDVSIVGPAEERAHPDGSGWRDAGTTSWLDFETGAPGTYVLGVSTAPRVIELEAEAFNDYLQHDGVLDVLEARRRDGELDGAVRELYSKHVKAVVQVGEARSDAWSEDLGYPIEIVPLANAAALQAGDALPVRILLDGEPLASQLVYASHAAHHAHDDAGGHVEAFSGRTDESGRVRIPVDEAGRWYVRLIHMQPAPEPDVDYESRWATLTFQVAERGGPSMLIVTAIAGAAVTVALLFAVVLGRAGRGAEVPGPAA